MTRRLLNLLTFLSLPLFIAAGVFWVRSHWIGDYLRGYDQPRLIECMSSDGLLMVSCGHVVSRDYLPPPGWEGSFWPFDRKAGRFQTDLHRHATLGFGYQRWRRVTPTVTTDSRVLIVPWWLLAAACAAPVVARAGQWRRDRRRRRRLAARCKSAGMKKRGSNVIVVVCGILSVVFLPAVLALILWLADAARKRRRKIGPPPPRRGFEVVLQRR